MNTVDKTDIDGDSNYHFEIRAVNEQLLIGAVHLQELADIALQTEQRLQDLIHGLDAVICEVDSHSGQATFLSLRSDTFLGRSLDVWRDDRAFLSEIIHPSDRARVMALIPTRSENAQNYEYDFRGTSPDDSWIYLRNKVRSVLNADGEVTLLRCVIVDVTEEKEIEQALEEAYARELNITETLQRSILFMPPEDAFPGLKVNSLYEPASVDTMVGGDFSDTFACNHGHVALILGDVMGHGLPAAMLTAELKYAIRAFVREHVSPGRILTQMNAYLCEGYRLHREGLNDAGDDSPLCLTLAIVDPSTGQAKVASAGMEPPLIIRRNGQAEEVLVGGLLLGIVESEDYEETAFQLEPGDTMVMTTDGVTESRLDGRYLGYSGLKELACVGWLQGSLDKMSKTIIAGSRAFAGGELKDDACILLAQRQ
jgi:PAS domain S-box-containing protein